MSAVIEFKHPAKKATDCSEVRDPLPQNLSPLCREIYLRIIRESEPGVLLRLDRWAVEVTARLTEIALTKAGGFHFEDSLRDGFAQLLLPELGEHYISQVLAKR